MIDFGNVKGLQSALEDPFKSNVSTIYNYENSEKTWQLIEKFRGEGVAIFTQPQGIIKCAGGMSYFTLLGFLQEEVSRRENERFRKRITKERANRQHPRKSHIWPTHIGNNKTPRSHPNSSQECQQCFPSHTTPKP